MPFNGFSEEYLDRLETNGNIQADNKAYAKRKFLFQFFIKSLLVSYTVHSKFFVDYRQISFFINQQTFVISSLDWSGNHGQVHRQLSVSSDSKLLDDDIREETRVIMRPKKPPRPKSEVFLNKHDRDNPRRKRFSAFGVSLHLKFIMYTIFTIYIVFFFCFYIKAKSVSECISKINVYSTHEEDAVTTLQ